MSASEICLLGLVGWSILLTFMVVSVRLKPILGGTLAFQQDGGDLPPFAQRVTRAHGNSLENLAIPVALILYGIATGQSAVTDGLAGVVLAARLGQSLVHMASGAHLAVLVRALLFVVQVVIWIVWGMTFYGG